MKLMQPSGPVDRHAARHALARGALLLTACLLASVAAAQTQPPAAPSAKPAAPRSTPPAAPTASTKEPAATVSPRARIELPAAERAALDNASVAPPSPSAQERNELLPQPEDAQATIIEPAGTVVEQVRQSNRISEVRVTPALTGHTWVMTNREGRQPIGATDTHSGLSVPKFFNFEFGSTGPRQPGAAAAPAAPPPPAPPSTQSR